MAIRRNILTRTVSIAAVPTEDREYGCPHCDYEGTQAQIVAHVRTDHVPHNLGDPRYGR
jgi:hypothetical protein